MDALAIFVLQFILSVVVWGLIANWLLARKALIQITST